MAFIDICSVAAYYAFANRIADGLGVELEPDPPSRPHTGCPLRIETVATRIG